MTVGLAIKKKSTGRTQRGGAVRLDSRRSSGQSGRLRRGDRSRSSPRGSARPSSIDSTPPRKRATCLSRAPVWKRRGRSNRCCRSPRRRSIVCSWQSAGPAAPPSSLTAAAFPRSARRGRPAASLPSTLGSVDWNRVERRGRGHERHRHLPRRAASADDPSRPAFLCPQFSAFVQHGADLRRARRARRGARRFVLPRRLHGRIRATDRHGGRRSGAAHRARQLPRASPRRGSSSLRPRRTAGQPLLAINASSLVVGATRTTAGAGGDRQGSAGRRRPRRNGRRAPGHLFG